MTTDERPLPDSLTRYLATPPLRTVGRAQPHRPPPGTKDPAEPRSGHRALEALVLRGFVYATSGAVWLLVLGLVLRHATR